jgi:1-acyl-sn-glycerol-3-phosphate acyltransferase
VRGARVVRSATFVLVYAVYITLVMGLGQRLIIIPLCRLRPAASTRIFASWVRFMGRSTLALLRALAGVRVTIHGRTGGHSCIVLMNHQSLLDIPLGVVTVPGPLPLIPTRRRYAKGIPGVSVFVREAGFPLISQKKEDRKADLAGVITAAKRTAAGETSLLIFPEGHRSRDGSILPFMPGGVQIALSRTNVPVYCVVADGMWRIRTLADMWFRIADTEVDVSVIGPFEPPADAADIPAFVERLRGEMISTLENMRRGHAA